MSDLVNSNGEQKLNQATTIALDESFQEFTTFIKSLNMHQLSKREKKIARQCIDKGLDAEFREGLEISAAIIQDWRSGKFESNRDAYHAVYKAIYEKDRAIGRRYDDLSGSRYLMAVASIFSDGYISEADIADFSDEAKAVIRFFNKD